MTFGKLFFGWLNDRIGTKRNFLLMTVLALCGILLLLISRSLPLTVLGVLLFGIGVASPFVLTPQLTIYFFGTKDFANIYGSINVFQFLGPAVAPTVTGLIYDASGSYTPAFLIYAALLFVALLVGALFLRQPAYQKTAS